MDLTGYTGTMDLNGKGITVGTSTAPPSNKALVFPSSGWTLTASTAGGVWAFSSTVASTTMTVNFGGKGPRGASFSAATTSGYQLTGSLVLAITGGTVTHTQGTLDTNGQACTFGLFDTNNSNTRTLTLGASAITINGTTGTVWDATTTTGLTFNANTSSITIGPAGVTGNTVTMNAGNLTYNTVIFAITGTTNQICSLTGSSPTFANLTVTGENSSGAILSLGTNITVTTALTLNGNNANTKRLFVRSVTVGTQQTITNNGITTTLTNLDLQDIAGAGSASWNLSAITGNSGDCAGNSGITFTTPRSLFWVGNTSNWSTANKWATSSGGTANQSNPLAQDNITFDSNSFNGAGQTVTCDMPRAGKNIDFTNVTNSPTFASSFGAGAIGRIYGSLTLIAGMTSTATGALTFEGRGSNTFTTANVTFVGSMVVNAPGGTLTLSGNYITSGNSNVSCQAGTLTTTSSTVTCQAVQLSANTTPAVAKTITMGSGTWTVYGTGFVWNTTNSASLTVNAQTSTIIVNDTSATSKTFSGNGFTYNVVTMSGDNITVLGANTFSTLNINNAGLTNGGLLMGNGVTQTITNLTTNGSAGSLATLASPGTSTLSKSSGTISIDYTNISNSHAGGGAAYYAGIHSTDGGGNTGWIFGAPSNSGDNFIMMGVG